MPPRTPAELDAIRQDCRALVARRATMAAGASAIPAFGLDIAADVAILMTLIPEINARFGLSDEQLGRHDAATRQVVYQVIRRAGTTLVGAEITRALVTRMLQRVIGQTATRQALRFVPVLGWAANAAIGYAAMRHVGHAHIDDCARVCQQLMTEAPALRLTHGTSGEPGR